MITTTNIDCSEYWIKPEKLLLKCGYELYKKKSGSYSYTKQDKEGRFEAYVIGASISLHYDVWIGKTGHMVLPSDYRTPAEKNRIISIMRRYPKPVRKVKKKIKKVEKILPVKQEFPPEKLKVVFDLPATTNKKKKGTLSQKELLEIDWEAVKEANKSWQNPTYPQSTTCTPLESMLHWIKTKVTPWL